MLSRFFPMCERIVEQAATCLYRKAVLPRNDRRNELKRITTSK